MRRAACAGCGTELPVGDTWSLRGVLYCQPCAEQVFQEEGPFEEGEFGRVADPTICVRCGTDYGEAELPAVGGQPVCDPCAEQLRRWPFPLWIKASFAGLLVLLAVSWVTGAGYVQAAADVVQAERALERREYREASALLADALDHAPDSGKALLLKAKADLLAGDPEAADEALRRFGKRSGDEELVADVNRILDRTGRAYERARRAQQLDEEEKPVEALAAIREAARIYPESLDLAEAVEVYEAALAFHEKDYATFLAIHTRLAERHPASARHVAGYASALACEYAVHGDPAVKARAEGALRRAEALAGDETLPEYAARIRHRLETREIIPRKEYDRRFRQPEGK